MVQAWTGLGSAYLVPDRVEVLRRKMKSVVYRLVGAGTGGSDVIVKSCLRDTAIVERDIYANVLPQILSEPVGYYGFADDGGGEFCWLFLADLRGDEFEAGNLEHREVATRWLARLHTRSANLAAAAELPDRGPGYYREHLQAARLTIRRNYGNPALSPGDREVLDRVLAQFDFVESRWEGIEDACRKMPRSLVHGDFAERNLRIRRGDAGLELVAFDWEVAGWGLPPVDLADADLRLYASAARDLWSSMDFETMLQMVSVCKLLRGGLAASNWTVPSLATEWVEKPILNLSIYQMRIRENLQALGWLR